MKFLVLCALLLSFTAQAQFDGRGKAGKVLRAFVIHGASADGVMVPGTEHVKRSEAVYPTADVTLVVQNVLKIVGKGIKAHTGEAVAFACIGAQGDVNVAGPSCDYLRAIYYNPKTQKVFAFGQLYYAGDSDMKTFFESLKYSFQQVHSPKVTHNKFIAFYSDTLSSKEGWNWSSSPSRVPYGRFLSIVADIEGATLNCFSHVKGFVFAEMIQPESPSIFSPWYTEHGGYGPNGGYYSRFSND